MLNQTRTLLLNRGAGYFPGGPDIHIPSNFHPVTLTPELTAMRNILFPQGLAPDAEEYIADTIMNVLHAPELDTYTLLIDPRTTYRDVDPVTISDLAAPSVQVDHSRSGTSDAIPRYTVTLANYPTSLSLAGEHSWIIRPIDARNVSVTPSRGLAYNQRVLGVGTVSKTHTIPLFEGYLEVCYDLPSGVLDSFKTVYTTFIAPNYNIGDRLARLEQFMLRPGRIDSVFGDWEPYSTELATLRTTWMQSYESVLKFGSLLIAYTYQIERLRKLGH